MDTTTVKISPKSWSAKLLNFCFRVEPGTINNLCPYFWLTVAGIILFPILFLGTIFSWPFRLIELTSKTRYRRFCRNLTKGQLYYLKNGYRRYIDSDVFLTYVNRLEYGGVLDEDLLSDSIKAQGIKPSEIDSWGSEFDKEIEELLESRKRAKKILTEIGLFTKSLMRIIWICSIIFLGFIGTTATIDLIYLIGHTEHGVMIMLGSIVVGAIWICLLYGFSNGISLSFKLWGDRRNLRKSVYLYAIPLWILYSPLLIVKELWYGIKKMSGLFGTYLRAAYKDYCPGIIWEERSKK